MTHPRTTATKSHLHLVGDAPIQGDALRLLQALGEPQAYGIRADTPDRVRVVTPRKGVSVARSLAAQSAADTLVAAHLAAWTQAARNHTARLTVSPQGQAFLARTQGKAAPHALAPHTLAPQDKTQDVPVTSFRLQHGHVETARSRPLSSASAPAVERAESPLAWLATRKGRNGQPLLTSDQFEAGERLRRDLTVAQMLPRLTANWSGAPRSDPSGAALSYSDAVIAARQRVRLALEAAGSEFAGLLMDVCGFLKGLETVEAERGWPPRSARIVLTLALGALARHYGMGPRAATTRGPRIRHWGTEDFRPTI